MRGLDVSGGPHEPRLLKNINNHLKHYFPQHSPSWQIKNVQHKSTKERGGGWFLAQGTWRVTVPYCPALPT